MRATLLHASGIRLFLPMRATLHQVILAYAGKNNKQRM
jgi:hypothetical protein